MERNDRITILRGADGTPQHVVLDWQHYETLSRADAAPGSSDGRATRGVPESVAARIAAGASAVRAWREHHGFSQAQLAALSGISRAYLTQIETGERVGTIEVLGRLSANLGCLVDDLYRSTLDDVSRRIDRLAGMPAQVAGFVAAMPRTQWPVAPSGGGFSLVQHVCHLRDIDAEGYAVRVARILAEEMPDLPDIDGDRLAHERDYANQDLQRALSAFVEARAGIVDRLRRLSEPERQRRGRMAGAGEVTIDDIISMMLTHDSEHLDELRTLRS